jgi:hypothetical protein
MQQAITALQTSVDRQQHRQHDDNGKASVQGGGDAHAPMLVIILLAKLVAMIMEVVVVVVLGVVEAVDLLPNVCVVNVMILILHNQPTVMRMGWANQNSPCPNSWVLLMLKSISIGS